MSLGGDLVRSAAKRREECVARGVRPRYLLVDRATARALVQAAFHALDLKDSRNRPHDAFYIMDMLMIVVPVPEMFAVVGSTEDEALRPDICNPVPT